MDKLIYNMIKKTYGLLKVAFVLNIILFIFTLIFTFINSDQQNTIYTYLSLFPEIVFIIACYLLLYSKNTNRKKNIAITLFIYAILNPCINVPNFFTQSNQDSMYLDLIGNTLYIAAGLIFALLSLMLLQKARKKSFRNIKIKPLFILYFVFLYISFSIRILIIIPSVSPLALASLIIGVILGSLLVLLLFQPQFIIYKALTYEDFYQNFIVTNPSVAISIYQSSHAITAIKSNPNGYCTNCGAPLLSFAAFCSRCGNKVNLE